MACMTTPIASTAQPVRVPASVWRIAAVASLGPLMTNLDSTVVNVALVPLGHSLAVSVHTIEWVTSAYLLALAMALPLSGWLVARWGSRRVYLIAFAGFTVASGLCAASPSANALIAARVLQGLFGGLLTPLAQMTIARAAGPLMSRVMGVAVVPVLLGPMFGPALGGGILEIANWRWLFLINIPFGIVALALAAMLLPRDDHSSTPARLDLVGLATLSPGLAVILIGLDRMTTNRLSAFVALAIGLCLIGCFIRRSRSPAGRTLIDIELLRQPLFATASATQFLSNGVVLGGQVLLPMILLAGGLGPAATGWMLAATGAGAVVSYPTAGRLVERLGPRTVLLGGVMLTLLGTAPFLLPKPDAIGLPLLAIALFVRGLGIGGLNLPSISIAYAGIERETIQVATTTINIVQRLGGPVAATLIGVVLLHSAGFAPAMVLLCVATIAMVPFGLRMPARAATSRG